MTLDPNNADRNTVTGLKNTKLLVALGTSAMSVQPQPLAGLSGSFWTVVVSSQNAA